MKRKYKIILIIIISFLITCFIYFTNNNKKINLVAIGDGISSGETSYNIDGISYNDYIKEYFENKKLLKDYNKTYALKNYKLNELLNDIEINTKKDKKLNIKQVIHNANIITINIGEEEFIKLNITNDLTKEYIKEFIYNYDKLIFNLKKLSEAKIIIIGFYGNVYLDKKNTIILNSNLVNIANKYDITFININDLLMNREYYLNKNDYYFNYKAHQEIAKMIINSL